MWARLWSRMIGGSRDSTGGGMGWRELKIKMKNILNKINGDNQSVRVSDNNDHSNYSIDSGIGSESISSWLDHSEEDKKNKDENDGHGIMNTNDKNSIKSSTSTSGSFLPSYPSKDILYPVSPQATPASIIKSKDPGRVRIKKSISFCEHNSLQSIQKPVRYNVRD